MRVILNGYMGKMGKVLIEMINARKNMEIVAGIDSNAESNEEFATFKKPADCNVNGDVIIDFSNHAAVPDLLAYAVKSKTPIVVATTALTEDEVKLMHSATEEIPVFNSSNMSIGINVISRALEGMMKHLEDDFDIEIIEKHHNMKKDSPSGTALLLADAINGAAKEKKEYVFGRHSRNDNREHNDIGIHAVRGGTIPGEHTVIFAGSDEIIEIKHTALSRKIFAKGAIEAAVYICSLNPGLYSMSNMIE